MGAHDVDKDLLETQCLWYSTVATSSTYIALIAWRPSLIKIYIFRYDPVSGRITQNFMDRIQGQPMKELHNMRLANSRLLGGSIRCLSDDDTV